jgi:hypothetical protein
MKDVPHRDPLSANSKLYEVIYSDVEGPMSVIGHDGSNFLLPLWILAQKKVRSIN